MNKKSGFTKIAYYLSIIAIFIELLIGFRYYNSIDPYERTFGSLTLLEGVFAFTGLLATDYFLTNDFTLDPRKKNYTSLDYETLNIFIGLFISLVLIQIIMQILIPITIRDIELAMSIVFAGVAEELFFRGVLVGGFIKLEESINRTTKNKAYGKGYGLMGVFLSSLFFALMHSNYYDNQTMMISTFLSGIILGIVYYQFKNISANIFAHFLLNIVAIVQMLGVVNL